MAKVMVVEDDNSLKEIYSIRLTAEGYEVVSASDGEEALAVAVREKPDLILSDVMMPKISGFDMLDILRQTPETKNIKVIIMTALSSEDQRTRGEGLGADKYLVKSQVGIEDVINAIHEVLSDKTPAPENPPVETPASQQPSAPVATPPAPAPTPVQPQEVPAPAPAQPPISAPTPAQPPISAPAPAPSVPQAPVQAPEASAQNFGAPIPSAPASPVTPPAPSEVPVPPSTPVPPVV